MNEYTGIHFCPGCTGQLTFAGITGVGQMYKCSSCAIIWIIGRSEEEVQR